MKRKWVILIVVVVAIVGLGVFLYFNGTLSDLSWQSFTMIFAAAAGPLKYLYRKVTEEHPDIVNDILEDHKQDIEIEKEERIKLDEEINTRKQELVRIEKEVETVNTQLNEIEVKKTKIVEEVKQMSTDEKKDEFDNLFGE